MLAIVLRASTCVGRGGEARRGPLRQAGRSSCLPAPLRLPQRAPSKREPSTQVLCAAYWSLKWMAPVPSTKKKVETMRPMMVVKDSTITTWVRVILVHQGAVSALGVGMLGDSPAGSANGRLAAAPLLAPKGLAAGLLVDGPNGLTGVLSDAEDTAWKGLRAAGGAAVGAATGLPSASAALAGAEGADAPGTASSAKVASSSSRLSSFLSRSTRRRT